MTKRVEDTMLCLQNSLFSICNNDTSTCSIINDEGFGSHAKCYLQSGVCNIPPKDMFEIVNIVAIKDLIGNKKAFQVSNNNYNQIH